MNIGLATWFLSGAYCSTFDEHFKTMLIYELKRDFASLKNEVASTNAIIELRHGDQEWQAKAKNMIKRPSDISREPRH